MVGMQHMSLPNAERQAAWRLKKAVDRLSQIPVVHGEGYSVYQGDALQIVPLLSGYHHCIADPPYEAEAHVRTRRTRAYLEGRAPYAAIDFAPITERERRLFATLTCGWILIFCQAEAVAAYKALLGAKYKRPLLWVKPDGLPQMSGDRPAMGYESIVCAWGQPGRSHWNSGGKRGIYTHCLHDGEPRLHPTQKPLTLLRELILDFTQPGDVVLDPFMGSGSCGVAAVGEGRDFLGIERDPATFQTACRRLAHTQRSLFAPARPQVQAQLL